MLQWWLCILFFTDQALRITTQPVQGIVENARNVNFDGKECCPCPKNKDYPAITELDSLPESSASTPDLTTARSPDDCACQPRDVDIADSAISETKKVPSEIEHDDSRLPQAKQDSKSLLHPEVGLALSVLETLREATNEEYKDALERSAARNAAKSRESTAADKFNNSESSTNSIVNIIISPPESSNVDEDVGAEETHVQETRCLPPLEEEPNISATSMTQGEPSLLKEIVTPSREPIIRNNILDSDNSSSNLKEGVDLNDSDNSPKINLRTKPLLFKPFSLNFNNLKLNRLTEPTNDKIIITTPSLPKLNLDNKLKEVVMNANNLIFDNDSAGSIMTERKLEDLAFEGLVPKQIELKGLDDLKKFADKLSQSHSRNLNAAYNRIPNMRLNVLDKLREGESFKDDLSNKLQQSHDRLMGLLKEPLRFNNNKIIVKSTMETPSANTDEDDDISSPSEIIPHIWITTDKNDIISKEIVSDSVINQKCLQVPPQTNKDIPVTEVQESTSEAILSTDMESDSSQVQSGTTDKSIQHSKSMFDFDTANNKKFESVEMNEDLENDHQNVETDPIDAQQDEPTINQDVVEFQMPMESESTTNNIKVDENCLQADTRETIDIDPGIEEDDIQLVEFPATEQHISDLINKNDDENNVKAVNKKTDSVGQANDSSAASSDLIKVEQSIKSVNLDLKSLGDRIKELTRNRINNKPNSLKIKSILKPKYVVTIDNAIDNTAKMDPERRNDSLTNQITNVNPVNDNSNSNVSLQDLQEMSNALLYSSLKNEKMKKKAEPTTCIATLQEKSIESIDKPLDILENDRNGSSDGDNDLNLATELITDKNPLKHDNNFESSKMVGAKGNLGGQLSNDFETSDRVCLNDDNKKSDKLKAKMLPQASELVETSVTFPAAGPYKKLKSTNVLKSPLQRNFFIHPEPLIAYNEPFDDTPSSSINFKLPSIDEIRSGISDILNFNENEGQNSFNRKADWVGKPIQLASSTAPLSFRIPPTSSILQGNLFENKRPLINAEDFSKLRLPPIKKVTVPVPLDTGLRIKPYRANSFGPVPFKPLKFDSSLRNKNSLLGTTLNPNNNLKRKNKPNQRYSPFYNNIRNPIAVNTLPEPKINNTGLLARLALNDKNKLNRLNAVKKPVMRAEASINTNGRNVVAKLSKGNNVPLIPNAPSKPNSLLSQGSKSSSIEPKTFTKTFGAPTNFDNNKHNLHETILQKMTGAPVIKLPVLTKKDNMDFDKIIYKNKKFETTANARNINQLRQQLNSKTLDSLDNLLLSRPRSMVNNKQDVKMLQVADDHTPRTVSINKPHLKQEILGKKYKSLKSNLVDNVNLKIPDMYLKSRIQSLKNSINNIDLSSIQLPADRKIPFTTKPSNFGMFRTSIPPLKSLDLRPIYKPIGKIPTHSIEIPKLNLHPDLSRLRDLTGSADMQTPIRISLPKLGSARPQQNIIGVNPIEIPSLWPIAKSEIDKPSLSPKTRLIDISEAHKERNSDDVTLEKTQMKMEKPIISLFPTTLAENPVLNKLREAIITSFSQVIPINDETMSDTFGKEEISSSNSNTVDTLAPTVNDEFAMRDNSAFKERKTQIFTSDIPTSPLLDIIRESFKRPGTTTEKIKTKEISDLGKDLERTDMINTASDNLPSLCASGDPLQENVSYKCKMVCSRD